MPEDISTRRFGMVEITVRAEPLIIGDAIPLPHWADTIEIADEAIQIVRRRYDEEKAQETERDMKIESAND